MIMTGGIWREKERQENKRREEAEAKNEMKAIRHCLCLAIIGLQLATLRDSVSGWQFV
jgi:hypothetical protein